MNLEIGYTPDTVLINSTAIDEYELNGILYNQDGVYYQTVINQFGCDSIIQVLLNFDYSGFNDENLGTSIYPNPSVDGVFNIPDLPANCTFELCDVLGRAVPFEWESGRLRIINNYSGQFILTISLNNRSAYNILNLNK